MNNLIGLFDFSGYGVVGASVTQKVTALLRAKAAEYIVVARCLLDGIECYLPSSEAGRIDVVVGVRLLRCQVKVLSRKKYQDGLSVRKTGGTRFKSYRYTKDDVDFGESYKLRSSRSERRPGSTPGAGTMAGLSSGDGAFLTRKISGVRSTTRLPFRGVSSIGRAPSL